jgi:hypothetical protein
MRTDPDPCRRRFLMALALTSAVPLAARAGDALAQAPPPPPPAAPPPAAPPAAPALSPDVAPYTQILANRHGSRVSAEQLAALAPDLDRMVQIGQRLRKVKLENGDEPDFVFRAVPGRRVE